MWQKLLNKILEADYNIWYYLNTRWHNEFLDTIVPFIRNQYFWAPLYLFLLFFVIMNYSKRGWLWCVYYLITFGIADYVSASIIKPLVHRPRPCNDVLLKEVVHLIVPCGGGYSFPSSHATNHFAMAVFIAFTLGHRFKWVKPVAMLWALSVAYAQVYVGVHFPLDAVCGALLGWGIGSFTAYWFNKKRGFAEVSA